IGDNVRISIAIFSYLDRFSFGITADYSAAPDLGVLTKGIRRGLAELAAQPAAARRAADPAGAKHHGADPAGAQRRAADPAGARHHGADPAEAKRRAADPAGAKRRAARPARAGRRPASRAARGAVPPPGADS